MAKNNKPKQLIKKIKLKINFCLNNAFQFIRSNWPAILLWIMGSSIFAFLSIYRHMHFRSNGYDLGIFDQTIWGYSQFQFISNTVRQVPNLLGDHFHPILVLLAPLYWIWNDVRMILLAQAILIASVVIPIYLWGKTRIGRLPSIVFGCCYLAFWGVIAAITYDFHEVAFAAPLLAWTIYGLIEKNNRLYWIAGILLLLTKENMALTLAATGLYALIFQKRWRLAIVVVTVSLTWFFMAIKLIIPSFSKTNYAYWSYTALGDEPISAAKQILLKPFNSIKIWFEPPKDKTIFKTFASWLFLPIFSPIIIIALPSIAERFWSTNPNYWGIGFQYSLVLSTILVFAAADTIWRMGRLIKNKKLLPWFYRLISIVLFAMILVTSYRFDAIRELRGIVSSAHASDINSCLAKIPKSASVAATSALIPHLTHRREIYGVHENKQTDFVAIDRSTSIWPLTQKDISDRIEELKSQNYNLICYKSSIIIYKK